MPGFYLPMKSGGWKLAAVAAGEGTGQGRPICRLPVTDFDLGRQLVELAG
jgi:hypothetical protein